MALTARPVGLLDKDPVAELLTSPYPAALGSGSNGPGAPNWVSMVAVGWEESSPNFPTDSRKQSVLAGRSRTTTKDL